MDKPITSVPINDWNARDAERGIRHPGFLTRRRLTSKAHARGALREVGAVQLRADDEPRVHNLTEGLSQRLGLARVDLFAYDAGLTNAFTGKGERAFVCIARSLISTFARTELEAVIAHCLVRHVEPARSWTPVGYADDVRAVAVTRFPPALVAAIRKAEPYRGKFAASYVVAEGPTHRPVEERAQALLDL